jgi:chromosome segregation ATPase
MTDSVISVDAMINLVQKLRQEKAECEEAISQTKHKARVLERRVQEVARQVGIATTAKEEKLGRPLSKTVWREWRGEAKERFKDVEEFEEELMRLSDKMFTPWSIPAVEVTEMCEMTRGRVSQLKGDISMVKFIIRNMLVLFIKTVNH